MRNKLFAVAALATLTSALFATFASAADHRDSPINVSNPTADINDVWAFRSPTDPDNLVIAISVNPLIAPSDNQTRGVFDRLASYQIHVDVDGDLLDDATVNIRRAGNSLVFEGLGAPIAATITPPGAEPVINDAGPVKVFAGTNVLAIVVELPVVAVTGGANADSGSIKTWVSSSRGVRIDRMAIPTINTVLIPSAEKDAFNAAHPRDDAANYRDTAIDSIKGLRGVVDDLFGGARQDGGPLGDLTAEQVGGALIPDVVTIDFSQPLQFPNGRGLEDDVIDAALGVVLNRGGAAGIGDGVSANDVPFLDSFPYLAEPHAEGGSLVTPPSTGDGGLLSSDASWALSGALLLVAITLAGAGLLAARSRAS